MYYIASASFGKDSLAMLLNLIDHNAPLDEVVFYDTGMEFDAIYQTRDRVLPLLNSHGIKYTELRPDVPFLYKMFDLPVIRNNERSCEHCKHYKAVSLSGGICDNPQSSYYQMHDEHSGGLPSEKSAISKGSCKLLELKQHTKFGYSWCGGRCRWGTTEKLKALDRYAEVRGATMYIGIAADEVQRLEKERKPYKRFPLVEDGMIEKACLERCYLAGFHWEEDGGAGIVRLYDILSRVSCWCCANKNLQELKNYYIYLPRYWAMLRDLQSKTNRPMKGAGKSVFELEGRFAAEIKIEKIADNEQLRFAI